MDETTSQINQLAREIREKDRLIKELEARVEELRSMLGAKQKLVDEFRQQELENDGTLHRKF